MPRQERQLCKVIEPKWKHIRMRPWVFPLTCYTLCKSLPRTTCQVLCLVHVSLVKGSLWIPWDGCWGPAVQPQCNLGPAWIWTALRPLMAPRALPFRPGPDARLSPAAPEVPFRPGPDARLSPAAPEVGGWPPTPPRKLVRGGTQHWPGSLLPWTFHIHVRWTSMQSFSNTELFYYPFLFRT